MANYHLSVKAVSRGKGHSVVEKASYRSGERLFDCYYGLTHDYTLKSDIVYKIILLPDNAPYEFNDRETLWNAVEQSERRSNSRLAREVEISLPNELTLFEQIQLVRNYVVSNFVNQGMCADVSFHAGHHKRQRDTSCISVSDNPHAHILLTTRFVDERGFNKKIRDWDKRENVELWRKLWAEAQNREFERKGLDIRVRHESYIRQGVEREPNKHLGHRLTQLNRLGIETDRINEHRAIEERNKRQYIHEKSRSRGR